MNADKPSCFHNRPASSATMSAFHRSFPLPRSPTRASIRLCKQPHATTPSRRSRAARWSCNLPSKLTTLLSQLRIEPDITSRYLHLARLGESLTQLSPSELSQNTRVSGCTSITHILVKLKNGGSVRLRGYSDAKITRGMVALLINALDGVHCDAVLQVSGAEVMQHAALQVVSSSRVSGMNAMIAHIHACIRSQQQHQATPSIAQPAPRYTSRQGADVAVLLSGGVDSSVALRLALEAGYRVHPYYLKIWLSDELSHLGSCPWEEDIAYGRAVCSQVGLTLNEVAFQEEYWREVVSYTVSEAKCGRTPNPDVMCNSRIKFGAFLQRFGEGFERVVSGHYARTKSAEDGTQLWLSADEVKDQTYFLAHLRQEQVRKLWFPVGEFRKAEVRELAQRFDLVNKSRKDSQGICFLGKLKFEDFLRHHLGEQTGELVEFESGAVLGAHKGFWFFTVGQRKGVRLANGPWYVVHKDVSSNTVYISRDYANVQSERDAFAFEQALWISARWPGGLDGVESRRRMRVKTRHGRTFDECTVVRTGEQCGVVQLDCGKVVAGGQFVAFYDFEGRCLGSAVIASPTPGMTTNEEVGATAAVR